MSPNPSHILRHGVYAPILTTFSRQNVHTLDLDAFSRCVARLAKADVGLIVGGTLGEGPLLSQDERFAIVKCAKDTLNSLGLGDIIPIIAGCMGQNVQECVDLARHVASAGADAIVAVAPGYFSFVYGSNKTSVKEFFTSIADESPIPVMLYNIPFAAGGIDMDYSFLADISAHPNIAGVKLTCGNIAKGQAVALHVNTPEYRAKHALPFLVLPGSTDYLVPSLVGRQHGCMGGPVNLYPKVCVKAYQTASKALETGDFDELRQAQELQDLITRSDMVINKVGFLGIKTAMVLHVDETLQGRFRQPLPAVSADAMEELRHGLAEIMELENNL